jgi:hypothetical protein
MPPILDFPDPEKGRQMFEGLYGPERGRRLFKALLMILVPLAVLAAILFVLAQITGSGSAIYSGVRGWFSPPSASALPTPASAQSGTKNRAIARAELERAMTEALVDARYSAEIKVIIEHQRDLLPLKEEYRLSHENLSLAKMKSPEAVAFFNQRLRESGKSWQITSQNIDSTFGNVMLDSSMNGPFTAGVKIRGGGGNTFDQTDINGARTGVDLEDTKDNRFSNTRINSPSETK